MFPWANSTAQKFGIPCLSFHGCSYFSQCSFSNLLHYQPQNRVSTDSEFFVVPDLPHEIKLTRLELTPYEKKESPRWLTELIESIREAQKSCYGVVMNSFYKLEPAYVDYYKKTLGMKHWHIGPLSLYFKEKLVKKCSIDLSQCMKWLDEKKANSVIYVCFGSMSNMEDDRLHEIAIALESLGQNFILVVRKEDTNDGMPHGFEERIKGQGLIVRGGPHKG